MTNQTIPPCPVCGTVPKLDSYKRVILTGECRLHILNNGVWCKKKLVLDVGGWAWYCNQAIGRACRELGIETVEQLKARLAPDPRVAVAVEALEKLARLGNGDRHGNSIGNCIAIDALKQIAAQRGEVEG